MTIPMVDLKGQYANLKSEIDSAIIEALGETRYILGPNVQAFDQEAGEYLGVSHAISCASGTDALHLALLAAGIEAGDEVITSAFTFIATAEAIRYIGATPVFVDIQPDSFNIDPERIRDAITERTRAILPVHLFGQPADMSEIMALADEFGLLVIEDCAQSFGSRYQDRVTGSIGAVGAFSFFPSKNLGCYGDGGMITTADDAIAARIKMLRNHGSSQQYHHDVIGYNSRLDELQAVILRIKLKHIDEYNRQRLQVAQAYNERLSGTRFKVPAIPTDRDYPVPLHRQQAFADTAQPDLPVTEETARRCLSLPIFPEMTPQQVDTVCEALTNA